MNNLIRQNLEGLKDAGPVLSVLAPAVVVEDWKGSGILREVIQRPGAETDPAEGEVNETEIHLLLVWRCVGGLGAESERAW